MDPIILTVVLAVVCCAAIVQLVIAIRGDGHGHRPAPRSHRYEVPCSQHEQLRRLAR